MCITTTVYLTISTFCVIISQAVAGQLLRETQRETQPITKPALDEAEEIF